MIILDHAYRPQVCDLMPRQAQHQRIQLLHRHSECRTQMILSPDKAAFMQTTRAQPYSKAIVHQHFHPIRGSSAIPHTDLEQQRWSTSGIRCMGDKYRCSAA